MPRSPAGTLPEHVYSYRTITPLALWNARAAGHDAEQVVDALVRYSRYPVPHALRHVADTMDRFGGLTLANNPCTVWRDLVGPRRARGGDPVEEQLRPDVGRPDDHTR